MIEFTDNIYIKSLEDTIEHLRKMAAIKEEMLEIQDGRIIFLNENIKDLQKIIEEYQKIILDYKKLV